MNVTHEVFNQPEPLVDYNLFDTNHGLRDALKFNAPQLATAELSALGASLGSTAMQTHARLANTHTPQLHRAAGFMLFTELEPSILCPISMTYAVTPALRDNAAIHADWAPRLTSRAYDPALKLFSDRKSVV